MQKVMPNILRVFKKACIVLAAIFVFSIVSFMLSACNSPSLSLPDSNSDIWGNGSSVVRMGEYTYFADGYVNATDVKSKNESYATLYRMKDGEDKPDKIASRVVGFEGSNMFIYGEHLYYVTPCQITETTGLLRNDQITVMRINLDGKGAKELYSSKSFSHGTGTVGFMVVDEKPYILVYEGTKIVRIDKNGNSLVLAEDVQSAAFATVANIAGNDYEATDFERYVYFTKARKATEQVEGNILYKREITNTSEEDDANIALYNTPAITVEKLKVSSGSLTYTRGFAFTSVTGLFKTSGIKGHEVDLFQPADLVTDYRIVTGNSGHGQEEVGFLFFAEGKILFKPIEANGQYLNDFYEIDSATKILFTQDAYAYYLKDNGIWRAKTDSAARTPEQINLSDWNASTDIAGRFDIDNQFFYFQAPIQYHEDDVTETADRDTKLHAYRVSLVSVFSALNGGNLDVKLLWEYVPNLDD